MDFANRSVQPQPAHPSVPVNSSAPVGNKNIKKDRGDRNKMWRVGAVALLFSITILAVAVIGLISIRGDNQDKYVDSTKYQAVFLTNGQVYFGKITTVGKDYFQLKSIFYLTQNTTTSATGTTSSDGNYTLVKLGCQQIHDPYDQMVIERDQVSFWENLQDKGKVVTSIKAFDKQNPNGPDCSQVSNETQATSNSTTQGSNSTTGTGTGTGTSTTGTTTTKP